MKNHELLAVESNYETQAQKVVTDLSSTFMKKPHLFEEKLSVFEPSVEDLQSSTEYQSNIQTTVDDELDWVTEHIAKSINASYAVAETNTLARADVILDDDNETVVLKNVPATALLELEKRMGQIMGLVKAIPTLDPAKGFVYDENRKYYVAREIVKTRTRKTQKAIVLYDATEKHPAQTQLITSDDPVGLVKEQEWSSKITPSRKAEMIDRVEQLTRAIRRARSRANEQEVPQVAKIGKQLLNFIFNK